MVGLFRKLEGKNRKLRFVAIDEIVDWHNNIYQCNIINKYRQGAFDSKLTQADKCHDCAFAQRKACKHFGICESDINCIEQIACEHQPRNFKSNFPSHLIISLDGVKEWLERNGYEVTRKDG